MRDGSSRGSASAEIVEVGVVVVRDEAFGMGDVKGDVESVGGVGSDNVCVGSGNEDMGRASWN